MKHRLSQFVVTATLAVGAVFAVAPSAHAVAITTAWDPLFGQPLPGVYWEGVMTHESSDGKASSLKVEFYKLDSAGGRSDIGFSPEIFNLALEPDFLVTSTFKDAAKTQVTNYSSNRTSWQKAASSELNNWYFSLQFGIFGDKTYAQLFTKSNLNASDSSAKESEFRAEVGCVGPVTETSACQLTGKIGNSIPTPVPEPGSLALVMAALAGAGLYGRRRSSVVPSA